MSYLDAAHSCSSASSDVEALHAQLPCFVCSRSSSDVGSGPTLCGVTLWLRGAEANGTRFSNGQVIAMHVVACIAIFGHILPIVLL